MADLLTKMIGLVIKRRDPEKKNPDKSAADHPEEPEIETKNPDLSGIERKSGAEKRDLKPATEMTVQEIGVKNPDPKVETE